MATTSALQTDGRIQRSERSREAIVSALLDLLSEGNLLPTAQEVAERADVGVRTVFRHFSDMETLYASMNERLEEEFLGELLTEPAPGILEERLPEFVSQRARLFSRIEPYRRANTLQLGRSPFLQEQYQRVVRLEREQLWLWLPEARSADPEISEAVELTVSFGAWDRLRAEQSLSPRKTAQTLERMLRALFRDAGILD